MTNFNEVWTQERTAKLTELWASGASASQVAAELGCFGDCRDGGRSAVCGKVNRLKLIREEGVDSPSAKAAAKAKKTRLANKAFNHNRPSRTPFLGPQDAPRLRNGHAPALRQNPSHNILARIASADNHPVLSEKYFERWDGPGIKMTALDNSTCRWPLGDPLDEAFLYCGDPSADLQAG